VNCDRSGRHAHLGFFRGCDADDCIVDAADVVITGAARNDISATMLGEMLVAAGRSVADEDDMLVQLQRVATIASEVIQGADGTGVTIDFGGRPYTVAHTNDHTLRVDAEHADTLNLLTATVPGPSATSPAFLYAPSQPPSSRNSARPAPTATSRSEIHVSR
jgi:hypothetical protein